MEQWVTKSACSTSLITAHIALNALVSVHLTAHNFDLFSSFELFTLLFLTLCNFKLLHFDFKFSTKFLHTVSIKVSC